MRQWHAAVAVALPFLILIAVSELDAAPPVPKAKDPASGKGTPASPASPADPKAVPVDSALATILRTEFWAPENPTELYPLLAHSSAPIRQRAALALARLRPPQMTKHLSPLLADPDPAVRRQAAFALGQSGDSLAVRPLSAAIGDSVAAVAAEAAFGLGRLGGKTAGDQLAALLKRDPGESWPNGARIQAAAAQGLARMADSTRMNPLLAALAAKRPASVTANLIEALEKIPRQTPESALLPHLTAPSPLVRARTARALGKITDRKDAGAVATGLAQALDDPEWRVRSEAARALGDRRDPVARPALGAHLHDASPHVRECIATALGILGPGASSEVEDALLAASTDTAIGTRRAAVLALGKVLGPRAKSTLATRMDDLSPFVAAAAVSAYAEAMGPEARDPLLARLDPGQPALVRLAAIAGLVEIQNPMIDPNLIQLLGDDDWVVASAAAEALGERRSQAAEPGLIAAARRYREFETVEARVAAVAALGRVGTVKSEATLIDALGDPDPRLREQARASADSLARHGVVLSPKLENMLGTARTESRRLPLGKSPAAFPLSKLPAVRRAKIVTPRGTIALELLPEVAPMAVESFVELAESGFHSGGVFHRVVPNFVIQGGCPRHDGYGGPAYALRAEVSGEPYETGALGMADAGLDTGGSQFFITHSPQLRLDARYTLFGRVTAGMAVVDRILQGDTFKIDIEPE
jgi:HEAT repeat protein/cyclophilin family peptidyl-prolyl cis-trans isomerase